MDDPGKQAAALAAADLIEDGMRLGLGTGSTVAYLLDALADRHLEVAGVPTSQATAARCRELGIGLLDLADVDQLDLCIDGADELDRSLALTKGGGGALLREKVVASISERMVVIATSDKLVDRLADTFPLPIEVVPFARWPVQRRLEAEGFEVALRTGGDHRLDGAFTTDNGNLILDARFAGGLEDPASMEARLAGIPGLAESGLFIQLAHAAVLGHADGTVRHLST